MPSAGIPLDGFGRSDSDRQAATPSRVGLSKWGPIYEIQSTGSRQRESVAKKSNRFPQPKQAHGLSHALELIETPFTREEHASKRDE